MERVIAEVVLRGPGGVSLLDAPPGAGRDVGRYAPDEDTLRRARELLEARDVRVEVTGPVGFTISCTPETFERVFGARVEPAPAAAGDATAYAAASPPSVPAELAEVVAGVALPTPPELFS